MPAGRPAHAVASDSLTIKTNVFVRRYLVKWIEADPLTHGRTPEEAAARLLETTLRQLAAEKKLNEPNADELKKWPPEANIPGARK